MITLQEKLGESSGVCCLFQPLSLTDFNETRLFKYNPNSAEQLAAIEGAVKDRREQGICSYSNSGGGRSLKISGTNIPDKTPVSLLQEQ